MNSLHGLPLLKRVATEHRRVVVLLVIGLVVNAVVYAFVVYPLARQVANIEERDQAAERALVAARAEHGQAVGVLSGKDQAAKELATFYTTVLPSDFATARRLTHLRVPQLARRANLSYESASVTNEQDRTSSLTRFSTEMRLGGRWADIRSFIHRLEADPEFVVIDNVQLTEGDGNDGTSLQVTLSLSTYYRTVAP